MLKACLIASQAFYGPTLTPDGVRVKENVVVLEKCPTPEMVNHFYERKWKVFKRFREWSKLG